MCAFARRPSSATSSRSRRSSGARSGSLSSLCSANRPASIRLARSTSCSAVSRLVRPIDLRYVCTESPMAGVWSSRSTPSANAATSASSAATSSSARVRFRVACALAAGVGAPAAAGAGRPSCARLLGGGFRRARPWRPAPSRRSRPWRGLGLAARRLELGLLVGQPYAGLAQLTQNGPSLSRRQSSLLERRPQVRKGQVTLAATALDQVVHARRASLLVSRGGSCDPRHETPPSFCHVRIACAVQRQHDLTRSPMTRVTPPRFTGFRGGHS